MLLFLSLSGCSKTAPAYKTLDLPDHLLRTYDGPTARVRTWGDYVTRDREWKRINARHNADKRALQKLQ